MQGNAVRQPILDSPPTQTILLIDDVPANLDVLLEHLQDERVRLLAATSGEDALRLALEAPPDLILLDIMMPGMDGYEVLRRLKECPETRPVPVIFLTAMSDATNEAKGLAMGAVDYIAKPFVVPVLKARVKNHLELKRKTDLLTQLASIDGLTGVANRRQLNASLQNEWSRCQRHQHPLSLILIDVDHFKPYNDHYGHGSGDSCLRRVAKALQTQCQRPGDLLARYGGEEFVALVPESTTDEAYRAAERLRTAVESLAIPHQYATAADIVTVSLGVASMIPDTEHRPESRLDMADRALYLAKEAGRNRIALG
jgi:diguanylate cyclase (GGDEF)-like protein